jgi:predicted lipid-binding transport protein (Tim44 family)
LAGIAAGLGLAALASHFGFGEELASAMMIGLAVMAVLAVVAFVMRKRALAQAGAGAGTGTGGMQYAGASAQPGAATPARPYDVSLPAAGAAAGAAGGSMIGANLNAGGTSAQRWPADFDAEGFARQAKVQFIRLQAAYDSANINDIREFTTPEMFAEIRTDLADRGPASSANDVVNVNAQVLDVVEEAQRYIVSVRFTGLMRDTQTRADEAFDEVWHLTKPRESQGGWLLSGIQQMS